MSEKIPPQYLLGLYEAAEDSLGVYPAEFNGEKRTPWQDGWNAYRQELNAAQMRMMSWFHGLPDESQQMVGDLLAKDMIWLRLRDSGEVVMLVNCNDLFYWACADAEVVALEEIPALTAELEKQPNWGSEIWACKKRGEKPQPCIIQRMREAGVWTDELEAAITSPRTLPVPEAMETQG